MGTQVQDTKTLVIIIQIKLNNGKGMLDTF